jgi:hypothetical protein
VTYSAGNNYQAYQPGGYISTAKTGASSFAVKPSNIAFTKPSYETSTYIQPAVQTTYVQPAVQTYAQPVQTTYVQPAVQATYVQPVQKAVITQPVRETFQTNNLIE